jgi:hypothetical protein
VAVGLAIADEDGTVLDFQDTRVGDGDFEDVRGEVFEACLNQGIRRIANKAGSR